MMESAGNNLSVPFTKIYNNISFNFKIYMSRGNDGMAGKNLGLPFTKILN